MQLTCGVDWAEAHHDVALVDMDGAVVARSRIDTGASGFNDLLALIAEHGGSAEHTAIALETDKNLLVVAPTTVNGVSNMGCSFLRFISLVSPLACDTAIEPSITDAWVPAAPPNGHGCGK